jgi:hypothetical protein
MKVFAANPTQLVKLNTHTLSEWNKTEPYLRYIYDRTIYGSVERDLFYMQHLFGSNPVKTEMVNYGDAVTLLATCTDHSFLTTKRNIPSHVEVKPDLNAKEGDGGDLD